MPWYRITNGKNYIAKDSSGKYTVTTIGDKATAWSSKAKATNVLCHCFKAEFLQKYPNLKVVPITDGSTNDIANNPEIKTWIDKVEVLAEIMDEAEIHRIELSDKLRLYESIISDVEHKLEFETLNAAELCKCAKKIQDARRKRRVVKDEIQLLKFITDSEELRTFYSQLDEFLSKMNTRVYHPKVTDSI